MTIRQNRKSRPAEFLQKDGDHGRIIAAADGLHLDTAQLFKLEESFRSWSHDCRRADIRLSRRRILLIFLLIRYSGAKLNEVLALDLRRDVDCTRQFVVFGGGNEEGTETREVQISTELCREIENTLAEPWFYGLAAGQLAMDPGFVRRKFYERGQECGLPKHLCGPEMLRGARAVELMKNNVPLPAVQMILGHASPHLTSSYVSFSRDEMQQVTRRYIERESGRRTSARNAFFGKVQYVQRGDIQARIQLHTHEGFIISTIITADSLDRLGLADGRLVTAEVKAPWVMLQGGENRPGCSADNILQGRITRLTRGAINTECIVAVSDMTEVCAVISTEMVSSLALAEGKSVWVLFNSNAVILRVD